MVQSNLGERFLFLIVGLVGLVICKTMRGELVNGHQFSRFTPLHYHSPEEN